jgi:predicted metalloprotease with PDZ domain
MIGGAAPVGRAAAIAGLIATSACAAETAPTEKSFTNEDGDFLLVPSKPGEPASEDSAGIGVHLSAVSGAIIVQSVMEGGVAARGGLKSGDEVLSIDGRRCQGMPLSAAAKSLRGRSGTLVVLRVRSKQSGKVKSYSFNRAPFPSVQTATEKAVTAKTVLAKDFDGACPKQHDGCRFLAKDGGECIYTCKTDANK